MSFVRRAIVRECFLIRSFIAASWYLTYDIVMAITIIPVPHKKSIGFGGDFELKKIVTFSPSANDTRCSPEGGSCWDARMDHGYVVYERMKEEEKYFISSVFRAQTWYHLKWVSFRDISSFSLLFVLFHSRLCWKIVSILPVYIKSYFICLLRSYGELLVYFIGTLENRRWDRPCEEKKYLNLRQNCCSMRKLQISPVTEKKKKAGNFFSRLWLFGCGAASMLCLRVSPSAWKRSRDEGLIGDGIKNSSAHENLPQLRNNPKSCKSSLTLWGGKVCKFHKLFSDSACDGCLSVRNMIPIKIVNKILSSFPRWDRVPRTHEIFVGLRTAENVENILLILRDVWYRVRISRTFTSSNIKSCE